MHVRHLTISLAAALVVSVAPAAAAAPDPVDVTVADLPSGESPTLAYTDADGDLVLPDGREVDLPRRMSEPMRVHGGYLVQVARTEQVRKHSYTVQDIFFVSADGERHRIWKNSVATKADQRRYLELPASLASSNGHLVLLTTGRNADDFTAKAVVKRVSNGHTVATRRLKGRPLAFRGPTVVFAEGPRAWDRAGRDRLSGYLARWNIGTDKVSRQLSNKRAKRLGFDKVAAVSLRERQAAVVTKGDRQLVRPLPGRKGPRWRTGRHELVEAWSPDGRYVLTIVTTFYGGSENLGRVPPIGHVRIRKARNGAKVAEFRGLLSTDIAWDQAPVWEQDSRSILMSAWDEFNDDKDDLPFLDGHGYVRCTVARSCELVLPRPEDQPSRVSSIMVSPFAAPRVR